MTEWFPAQPGDIFCCWGTDWISRFVSAETSQPWGPRGLRWAPSHVAIACSLWYPNQDDGCRWWESTTLTPRACIVAGHPVRGVQVHGIRERIRDYVTNGGRVAHYRLTDIDRLTHLEETHLRSMLGEFCSGPNKQPVNYDTVGAICSGTRVVRRFTAWRNQTESLFCSELIAAVLQRLGRMCRRNPALFNPGQLMRALVTQGTYTLNAEYSNWIR